MQYSCHLDSCGDTTYFDPSTAAGELTSNSSTEDSYIVKLNSGGTFLWVVSTGSTSDDDYGESITVDSLRNAYVTGVFYDTVNFGATAMTANGGGVYLCPSSIEVITSSGRRTWDVQAVMK